MAVQAIHAAIEASRQFLPPDADHPHLVLCGVASEQRLLAAADHLFKNSVRFALFREPDRGGEATALATEPLVGEARRLLRRYQCLTVTEALGVQRAGSADFSSSLGKENVML